MIAAFLIRLPKTLPTKNVVRRMNWRGEAALVRAIRQDVKLQALSLRHQERTPVGFKAVLQMTLYRGKGQRMLDPTAVVEGLKPVVDALVDAALLVDDNHTWCDYRMPHQKVDHLKGPSVLIELDWPEAGVTNSKG